MTKNKTVEGLITLTDPESVAAEAYRILRTNISLKDPDQELKVINVISTAAQESKSTTVLNLAYVYSQLGKKTLVIDLDLRVPSLHKKLKVKNSIGVTDVVSRTVNFSDAVIHFTNNLDILLSGSRNPFASEFIQSRAFNGFLEALRQVYDVIIIDCPPVGLVTDGMITSTLCDGTILCVATGVNDRRDLERIRDQLDRFNVNVLGIVMTRMVQGKKYYGRYGRYGYGYAYGRNKGRSGRKGSS